MTAAEDAMADAPDPIQPVAVEQEFRACPACGYDNGFHVSFVRQAAGAAAPLRVVLICPSCGARHDVDWTL
jgi:hypothetical protein